MSTRYSATLPASRLQPAAAKGSGQGSQDDIAKALLGQAQTASQAPLSTGSKIRQVRIVLNQLGTFAPILGATRRAGGANDPKQLASILDAHKRISEAVVRELDLDNNPITLAQVGRGIASLVGGKWGAKDFDEEAITNGIVEGVQILHGADMPRTGPYESAALDDIFGSFHTVSRLSSSTGNIDTLSPAIRGYLIPPDGDTTRLVAELGQAANRISDEISESVIRSIESQTGESIDASDRINSAKAWKNHVSRIMQDVMEAAPRPLMARILAMSEKERTAMEAKHPDGILCAHIVAESAAHVTQLMQIISSVRDSQASKPQQAASSAAAVAP